MLSRFVLIERIASFLALNAYTRGAAVCQQNRQRLPSILRLARSRYKDSSKAEVLCRCERTAMPDERFTEYVATILLVAVATPFFEQGTGAALDGHYLKAVALYAVGCIPLVAGLLTIRNYWPRLRTRFGDFITTTMLPFAANPRWWFGILLFVLLWFSWPELATKVKTLLAFRTSADATSALKRQQSQLDALESWQHRVLNSGLLQAGAESLARQQQAGTIQQRELQVAVGLFNRLQQYNTELANARDVPGSKQYQIDVDMAKLRLLDDYHYNFLPTILALRHAQEGNETWRDMTFYSEGELSPGQISNIAVD
jgi:hypothetical protein